MDKGYSLLKFSFELQDLIYEKEKLRIENEELKKQLKMFEDRLRDDLVVQQKTTANWLRYCLKKVEE